MTCRPGHPARHPDFEPGHTLSLKHGVDSQRSIEAKAAQVHAEILTLAPWLAEPAFVPELARYLRASAREQLAHDHLMVASKLSPRLLEAATSSARLASQLAAGLGLTPAGHARLKAMTGHAAVVEHTLADLMASGRESRLAAEARMATTSGELPQEPPDEPEEMP